jgi:molecular chaperone GrpE (heat shock protein)
MEKEMTGVSAVPAAIEEIADGMLDILQRLANLERQWQESGTAIAELRRYTQDSANHHSRTLEALRAEVAGERKSLALRMIFEPVATALDSLEMLRQGLVSEADQHAHGQLTAAVATLANTLTALGFERFDVAAGERFDPNRMQCFGYAEGEPGLVLEALQPGYTAASVVVRPASVLIADPSTS